MRNNLDGCVTPGAVDGGQRTGQGGSPRGPLREAVGGLVEKSIQAGYPASLRDLRAWFDREVIIWALEFCAANATNAATLLGISRDGLYGLMRRLGVSRREIKARL